MQEKPRELYGNTNQPVDSIIYIFIHKMDQLN